MAQREELILDITARLDQALRDVGDLQAQVEALTNQTAEVTIAAAVEGAEAVEELATTTEDLDGTEAAVTLAAEDEATAVVDEVTTGVGELDGAEAAVTLAVEDEASEIVEEVTEGVDDLDGAEAEVELDADDNASDTVEDVQDAVDDLDGDTAEVELKVEGGEEANETISGLGTGLLALGPAALGGIAAAGLTQVAEASAQATLDIQALADATGTTLETASGLVEQFDFVGVSASKLETLIGRVSDKIGATPGLAERLNVDASLGPVELFIASVDALNNSQLSATDKIALGIDVFGRKGLQSVQAIGSQIGDLGAAVEGIPEWQVVTEEDTQSAIEFKQTMDEIGDQVAEVAQTFLTVLGPAIQDAFEKLESLGSVINSAASLGQEGTARSVYDYFKAQGDAIVALQDEYLALGGTIESLEQNYFHLNEVTALLDLGVPPEVIAQADLTDQAVGKLIETMSDSAGTATAMADAFADGAVSLKEWQQITADGVITMAEVEAAINNTDIALATAAGGADEFSESVGVTTAELNNMLEKLPAAAGELGDFGATWQQVVNDLEDGGRLTDQTTLAVNYLSEALQKSPEDILSMGQAMADANLTTGEMNEALTQLQDPLTILPDLWETLINDVADGSLDFENAKGAVDLLADATGLSADKILAMADAEAKLRDQKLAEQLEKDAAAAEELAAAMSLVEDEMNSAEARTEAWAGAMDRLDFGRLDEGQEIAGFADDLNALGEAVKQVNLDEFDIVPPSDDWQAWLNMPDEAQGVLDAMGKFRTDIEEEMGQAFAADGAQGVRAWAEDARTAITDELRAAGVESQAAIDQVLGTLGLLPSQVTTQINIAVDEQKLAIIGQVVSNLEGIPPQVAANIQMAINNQDPQAALDILNTHLRSVGDEPVTITYNADTGQFDIDVAAVTEPLTTPVTVDDGGTVDEFAGAADEATEDRTTNVIVPKSPSLGQMQDLIDHVARARTVNLIVRADNAGAIASILDGVARNRDADIVAEAHTGQAEYELNNTARTRHSYVVQHTVGGGGGGQSGQGGTQMAPAGVATLTAAPTALSGAPSAAPVLYATPSPAPAPVVHNHVTVQAAVIGNRFEVQRAVAQAMRGAVRLGGRR